MFHALTATCENEGCADKTAHVGTLTAPLMCRFLLARLVLVKLATLITCDTETASDKSRSTLLRDASTYMSCCINLTSINLAEKQLPAVDEKFQDKKDGITHQHPCITRHVSYLRIARPASLCSLSAAKTSPVVVRIPTSTTRGTASGRIVAWRYSICPRGGGHEAMWP